MILPLLPLLHLLLLPAALARPEAPALFCDSYSAAPGCATGTVACTTCHALAGPPAKNPFGSDLFEAMSADLEDGDFEDALPAALIAVQDLDSDGDGVPNQAEILAGTEPGWDDSLEPECFPQTDRDNDAWTVGSYDPTFAYKRVMLDFCGRSPRYEELRAFAPVEDPEALVQDTLALCLDSPYWSEILRELAIGVVEPIGPATDVNLLGNWEWDLRLWQYAMSDDRDAADVMLAQYLVIESPAGSGRLEAIDDPRSALENYAQPLDAEDRYGLITTRHNLAMRVMFSDVPRNLASHAYRVLLGNDLARSEGLYSMDELDGAYDWPSSADVDDKGVWQEGCAACHATLDPLSYPWARYNGIDLEGNTTATWVADRATDILPDTRGAIFGEPVDGPGDWVLRAVESDDFAEHTVGIFWERVMGRAPYSCEADTFEALWRSFKDGRNVESMLSELVLTDAYGVP